MSSTSKCVQVKRLKGRTLIWSKAPHSINLRLKLQHLQSKTSRTVMES